MTVSLPTGWINYFSGCAPAQGALCTISPFAGDPITAGPIEEVRTDPQNPAAARFWSSDNEAFTIQSRYNGFECCGYQAIPLFDLPDEFYACDDIPGFPPGCVPGTVSIEIGVNIVLDSVSNGQSGIFLGRSVDSPSGVPPGYPGIGSTSDYNTVISAEYDEQSAVTGPTAAVITKVYGLGGTETICDSAVGQALASCVRGPTNPDGLQAGDLIEINYSVLFPVVGNPYVYVFVEVRPGVGATDFSTGNPYGTPCLDQSDIRLYIQSGDAPGLTEADLPNRAGIYTSGSVDGDANRIGHWRQFCAWKRRITNT